MMQRGEVWPPQRARRPACVALALAVALIGNDLYSHSVNAGGRCGSDVMKRLGAILFLVLGLAAAPGAFALPVVRGVPAVGVLNFTLERTGKDRESVAWGKSGYDR